MVLLHSLQSQSQDYTTTVNVPFFVEFNSSYEVDDTITQVHHSVHGSHLSVCKSLLL